MSRAFVHTHVVTFDETNMVGNVYFAHFLHWQGHSRERFLATHAPGVLIELRAGRLALVTVSCAMDYYEECFALDELEVHMRLRSSEGSRVGMDFEFRRTERLVARGTQTVACMVPGNGRMVPGPVPDELDAALAGYR